MYVYEKLGSSLSTVLTMEVSDALTRIAYSLIAVHASEPQRRSAHVRYTVRTFSVSSDGFCKQFSSLVSCACMVAQIVRRCMLHANRERARPKSVAMPHIATFTLYQTCT